MGDYTEWDTRIERALIATLATGTTLTAAMMYNIREVAAYLSQSSWGNLGEGWEKKYGELPGWWDRFRIHIGAKR